MLASLSRRPYWGDQGRPPNAYFYTPLFINIIIVIRMTQCWFLWSSFMRPFSPLLPFHPPLSTALSGKTLIFCSISHFPSPLDGIGWLCGIFVRIVFFTLTAFHSSLLSPLRMKGWLCDFLLHIVFTPLYSTSITGIYQFKNKGFGLIVLLWDTILHKIF